MVLTLGPHQYVASLVSQERCDPKPYPCLKEKSDILMRDLSSLAHTSTDIYFERNDARRSTDHQRDQRNCGREA